MSLYTLPVTAAELEALQLGIGFFQDATTATSEAAAISAATPGGPTVYSYAASLLSSQISLSQVAMADSAYMEGTTVAAGSITAPATNTLALFTTQFLPPQVAYAVAHGFNPTVFAAQSLGEALSTNAAFNTNYVSLTPAAFASAVATLTSLNANSIAGWLTNWLAFYTANAPTGATITQAAYGATFGDAIGTAILNPTPINNVTNLPGSLPSTTFNTVQNQTYNALKLNGEGLYTAGVAIGALPQETPLQGEATNVSTGVYLTQGIDSPTSGFSSSASGTPLLNGFTATAKGQVFNALPFVTALGLGNNTLNTGDNLQTTGAATGTAILNDTTASGLVAANPAHAIGVTMNGVATANITNNTFALAGFAGTITGLTSATLVAGSIGAVELGLAGDGLNTALANVTVNASEDFTAWMTAAAFGTGTDSVTVTLGGVDTVVTLDPTTGTTGYGTITVASDTSANTIALTTTATTTATIHATGAQNLDISGSALNKANLHTFDGSTATGNLDVWFTGTGHVSATGGSGNDDFIFGTVNGTANFTAADKVDGGGGTNTLTVEVETGAILLAGVGSNITHTQTIEQISNDVLGVLGHVTAATSADMALAGSATTLALDANYDHNNVTVTDLTTADTVTYGGTGPDGVSTGSLLGNLTLSHATPIGILDTINFTMDSTTAPAELTVDALTIAATSPALATLNLTSTGNAATNVITNVSAVADNVAITGATPLVFGSAAGPYSFMHGVIDASGDTGGVTTWLSLGEVSPVTNPTPLTTFIAGTGTDIVNLTPGAFAGNLIDFSKGGTDTVQFTEARYAGDGLLTNNPPASVELYNSVLGFTQAHDTIDITNSGILTAFGAVAFTNDGTVPAGAATSILQYTGTSINASALPDNWIKIDPPTSGAGQTAAEGLASAIGGGTITVAASHPYLVSYYDLTDSQAVFETIHTAGTTITAATATNANVNVIGLAHMSQADYAAFSNLHFT